MMKPYAAIAIAAALLSGPAMAQTHEGQARRDLRNALISGSAPASPWTPSLAKGGGPENDLCSSVVPEALNVGGTLNFQGSTTGATDVGDFVPGSSLDGLDPTVWHAFTLTECATVTVSYCSTSPPFASVWLFLSPGCPAGDDFILANWDDETTCPDNNRTMEFTALEAGTYYLPVRYDADNADGPYTIEVSAAACPVGYCSAGATNLDFEKILSVDYVDISNVSFSPDGYEDFTSIVGTVERGSTNDITVFLSEPVLTNQVLVWIDLDQSLSFEPDELLYVSDPGDGPHIGPITIPPTATLGQTRMRVRLHDVDLAPNDTPCGTTPYGQVEDYTLNITGASGGCDAFAGTLSGGGEVCLDNGTAMLTATADGNSVEPAGFSTVYLLTTSPGLVVLDMAVTPDFQVNTAGGYAIHTLVFDPNTLDLGTVDPGVTTASDMAAQLIQGGGTICASLDMDGAAFVVADCSCPASSGTLSGGGEVCLIDGTATLTATADGNSVEPAGFSTVYLLTTGPGLVVLSTAFTPNVQVGAVGDYAIHTLVYDPNTLPLAIDPGVTTAFDIAAQLVQGGGGICASLDMDGAAFTVTVCAACDAFAGTLTADNAEVCLENGEAIVSATPNGDAVVPVGYETAYVLTEGVGLVIVQTGTTPSFTVTAIGDYRIHALVYDPATLDLGTITLGMTTAAEVVALLEQGGGTICASLDVDGTAFTVAECGGYCAAGAGGGEFSLDEWIAQVSLSDIDNALVPGPAGYQDFTDQVGTVRTSQSYPFSVTIDKESGPPGYYSTDQVLIWVDFNQDEDFDDPDEQVFVSTLPLGAAVVTGSITIPASAQLGTTRMRIRLHDTDTDLGQPNPTPCGNSHYGQVEDYGLRIDFGTGMDGRDTAPWRVFPNPGDGDLTIQYGGAGGMVQLDVLDVTGRLVHGEQRLLGAGQQVVLPLAGRLSAGTYVLRLTSGDERHEQRVVVH